MAIFVYPTRDVLDDAQRHAVGDTAITSLCEQIERTQSLSRFDRFPPPYLTLKKFHGRRNRVIAAEHQMGEHLLVILLRVLIRGSQDYSQYEGDTHGYASRLLDSAKPTAERWLADRTRRAPPPALEKPTPEQQSFLWAECGTDAAPDAVVCETEQWMRAVDDERVRQRLVRIPAVLVDIAQGEDRGPTTTRIPDDPRLQIAYRWYPQTRQLLLLDIGIDRPVDAAAAFNRLEQYVPEGRALEILRVTRRSYPLMVCCDDDVWMAIQRDDAANMALSPEEIMILRSVRVTSDNAGFPLFINGRAGSGKSTLLQYLFADCVVAWSTHLGQDMRDRDTAPLYLAASDDLLSTARAATQDLLKANAQRLIDRIQAADDTSEALKRSFRRPVELFRQIVRNGQDDDRFSPQLQMTYPQYRRHWLQQFGRDRAAKRDLSSQLTWHVIRTHIKGEQGEALDPDEYAALPRDEQTVSQDRFAQIHERVWQRWYLPLCRSNGFWDDQDLAAAVVESDYVGRHCAVFCDEAQDFTRLDLEALHRCCAFSFLQLSAEEAARVPFVFAGDPFQTLNPTGFRWEAVKAAFTEKIAGNLYRSVRRDRLPDLNYRELTFNYRSTQSVVRICNSIQAARALVMDVSTLRPQSTWHLDTATAPGVYFHLTDPATQQAVRDQADLVMIIPCEQDEEVDFVNEHADIRALVRMGDDGIPQNVLSPARAKGLEFNRVAIVGFGSAPECAMLRSLLLDPKKIAGLSPEERLPLEYFLNKLYVACSRARRRLFVLERPDAVHELWSFMLDEEALDALCGQLRQANDEWRGAVGSLVKGIGEYWEDDRNDPNELAVRFEAEGKSSRDPYLLQQAALLYERAEEVNKALMCRGLGLEIQGKCKRAGELFASAGDLDRALACFWEAEAHDDIVALGLKDGALRTRFEYRVATFFCNATPDADDAMRLLEEMVRFANVSAKNRIKLRSDSWRKNTARLERQAAKALAILSDPKRWAVLVDSHVAMRELGMSVEPEKAAEALIGAEQYEHVVSLLADRPDTKLYRRARACILIGERNNDGEKKIATDDGKLVGDVLFDDGNPAEAIWWYGVGDHATGLHQCFEALVSSNQTSSLVACVRTLGEVLVKKKLWEEVAMLLDSEGWQGLSGHGRIALRGAVAQVELMKDVALRPIAVSDSINRLPGWVLERIYRHLRPLLPADDVAGADLDERYVRLLSGAVERVGRDIDALAFYEGIFGRSGVSSSLREYAEKRWIRCKMRQEERDRATGRRVHADRHREQIESRLRKYGWKRSDMGHEYPTIRPSDGAAVEPSRSETPPTAAVLRHPSTPETWSMGNLFFQRFQATHRVNIESEVGEQAKVDLAVYSVQSGDVEVARSDETAWTIPSWKLNVAFDRAENVVRFTMDGAEICVDVVDAGSDSADPGSGT